MSFITFDYLCKNCDEFVGDALVRRSEMNNQECSKCGALMFRLPAGPTTTFKFGDRSATKSKKVVSLRDPNPGVTRAPLVGEL